MNSVIARGHLNIASGNTTDSRLCYFYKYVKVECVETDRTALGICF